MIGRNDAPDRDEDTSKLKGFDDFDLRLGDIMRGERATMGKSLLDVQRELKIKATYISAIENTDPSAFDTPGFVAGYVRSYARYLNMDPEWAFKTFCEEGNFEVAHGMSPAARIRSDRAPGVKKSAAASAKPAHLRDPFTDPSVSYLPKGEATLSRVEPRAIASVVVLIALLAGIGYGGWAVLQEVQKVRLTPVDQTPRWWRGDQNGRGMAALFLFGIAWLWSLIGPAGYPISMVSVPGEEFSNTRPPTTAARASIRDTPKQ